MTYTLWGHCKMIVERGIGAAISPSILLEVVGPSLGLVFSTLEQLICCEEKIARSIRTTYSPLNTLDATLPPVSSCAPTAI